MPRTPKLKLCTMYSSTLHPQTLHAKPHERSEAQTAAPGIPWIAVKNKYNHPYYCYDDHYYC